MPKFVVTLKRVVYAEITVEADTAQKAREQVEQDGPHDHFVQSQSVGTDETTVVKVRRPEQTSPTRRSPAVPAATRAPADEETIEIPGWTRSMGNKDPGHG